MATTEPIRNARQAQDLFNYYYEKGEERNYAMVVLATYTALRITDLLALTWDNVYDFKSKRFKKFITLLETKTKKTKIIALNKNVITALKKIKRSAVQGKHIISNERTGKPISRVQAYRIIRSAGEALGMTSRISCHSLRKTFGYHAWKSGASPQVIMDIYNHSSYNVTRRYIGITQDDKNDVYLKLNIIA